MMKKGLVLLLLGSLVGMHGAHALEQTPFGVAGHAKKTIFVATEDCARPSQATVEATEVAAELDADRQAQETCGASLAAKRVSVFEVASSCGYSGPWNSVGTLYQVANAEYVCISVSL